ncbi:hypothetical protein IJ135_00490, partial [Candidatus Saccharibacteria bacterium]|nr:hypothetical protein [Candidatus Saccharibacteria bacterium]
MKLIFLKVRSLSATTLSLNQSIIAQILQNVNSFYALFQKTSLECQNSFGKLQKLVPESPKKFR